ncbi:MAG: NUDIX domain-containing protein [Alphaproteobacteria bacterium]|nr:NUDIX domain-containing protein [Alphaproteobacteria bacterium]
MPELCRGASMAVFQDGNVLLVRRARPPLAGLWSLPGGRRERGETAAEAALREVREETGVRALIAGRLGLHVARFTPPGSQESGPQSSIEIDVFYGTTPSRQSPVAADDADAAAWVPLDSLDRYDLTVGAAGLILAAAALLADNDAAGIE